MEGKQCKADCLQPAHLSEDSKKVWCSAPAARETRSGTTRARNVGFAADVCVEVRAAALQQVRLSVFRKFGHGDQSRVQVRLHAILPLKESQVTGLLAGLAESLKLNSIRTVSGPLWTRWMAQLSSSHRERPGPLPG